MVSYTVCYKKTNNVFQLNVFYNYQLSNLPKNTSLYTRYKFLHVCYTFENYILNVFLPKFKYKAY